MTLRLSPDRSDEVSAAIREVCRKAHEATLASDTEAARKALRAVSAATLRAGELLNTAEREARGEALLGDRSMA